jgi:uncharacterized membrane protein (UPF0127 family)
MYPKNLLSDGTIVRVTNRRAGTIVGERVEIAAGVGSRLRGLLGRGDLVTGEGLWLQPCSSIHMFFMRFPIDALFVDDERVVVRCVPSLRPWTIAMGGVRARAVLELAVGSISRSRTNVGDSLALELYETAITTARREPPQHPR